MFNATRLLKTFFGAKKKHNGGDCGHLLYVSCSSTEGIIHLYPHYFPTLPRSVFHRSSPRCSSTSPLLRIYKTRSVMSPKETAFYDLLQVPPTATPAQIRKSFRVLALRHHPDRAGNSPEAVAHFQQLHAVYDLLLDPDRRAVYDANGDDGTLHGGDPIDTDAAAAFFAAAGGRVSEEDIVAYELKYRGGEDEKEDLISFYRRFEGKVGKVLEYIPYSDESDLVRFVHFWDEQIKNGELDDCRAFKRAKKNMLKQGQGKERDMQALQQAKAEGGKKTKETDKEEAPEDDLVSKILARRKTREDGFDAWADGIAARAEVRAADVRTRKKKRQNNTRNRRGAINKKRNAS